MKEEHEDIKNLIGKISVNIWSLEKELARTNDLLEDFLFEKIKCGCPFCNRRRIKNEDWKYEEERGNT